MKRNQSKMMRRVLALILSVLIVIATLPVVAAIPASTNRIVDPSTMDGWKSFFGPDVDSTENAGTVWMDKSVFTDASEFISDVKMTDDENNFLVALSAIASNKEIVGYSTIPTDTMLVLDVSGSMDESVSSLVTAANSAIKTLLNTNLNNRVGVVLYSGNSSFGASTYSQGARLLLPLDRYTTRNDIYIRLNGSSVEVSSNLRNSENEGISASKRVEGGTYIQSGIYEALKQFENKYNANDTVVGDNFQDGQKRLPIMVLMSDGAPTTATSSFAEVGTSNAGNGGTTTDEIAFLTQLTASYALSKMEEYYDSTGEGLFYTLGLAENLTNDQEPFAKAVLDPSGSQLKDIASHWEAYLDLSSSTALELTVPGTSSNNNNKNKEVSVYKNSYAINQYYVDEYFEANSSNDLIKAFESIVQQIIIQSRYYPTSLEGGNPDFSGYIVFEDRIGEYMEVKDIKGILAHGTLFTGAMLTSKINSSSDGLGTVEDPTEFGLEFINAVKTRLGITSDAEVNSLLKNAWNAGQLYYENDTDFSNYIGWYASADGKYLGFYNEGTTTPPEDAVYANKSYGMLGTSGSSIAPSDMMFMSIQVHTNIITKDQTVIWKIPAALVPLVTYKVTLEGTSIEAAENVEIEYEGAEPIRLIFETGLRSDINELNVSQIINQRYIADDGITRQFYTNYWDNSAAEHTDHIAAMVGFTPSEQNERYYYTENATVYKLETNKYNPVTDQNHTFSGDYYHARWIFQKGVDTAVPYYEKISDESMQLKKYDSNKKEWYIPLGTVYKYYDSYIIPKSENVTESIIFSAFPYVTRTNASYEVDAKLGNNGILYVTPATGIKLSKTIDIPEVGASDTFRFNITLSAPAGTALKSEYPILIAELDNTEGTESTAQVKDGVMTVELKAGQTVYITDLPNGTAYTIEETGENDAYKIQSVHVNGVASVGDIAAGHVVTAELQDVDFVNTPISEGNLVISKSITHPFGADYTVNPNLTFTARVTLTNSKQSVANKTYAITTQSGNSTVTTNAQGQFTVSIKNGESVSVHGIPENTAYTVTEVNIPAGFALDSQNSSGLSGEISSDYNAVASLVNDYTPDQVNANITVEITKTLSGREWKSGDSFTFVVEKLNIITRETNEEIARAVITDSTAKTVTVSLAGETYTEVGTYHYRIREIEGQLGGITYDLLERRFSVNVTDTNTDGKLEISSVENDARITLLGNAQDGFKVSAAFENTYKATVGSSVTINVQKHIEDQNFQLNGFRFALYDENGEYAIHESTVTDVNGRASIEIGYSASDVGKTFKYILKEIDTGINGMTYDAKEYPVSVQFIDNLDGTTKAQATVSGIPQGSTEPEFTNHYDPTDATVIISATKSMVGRVLNESEFEFELYELDNANDTIVGKTPVQTVKNTSNGSILFDAVTFDAAGEFYYAVAEKQVVMGGVECDDTVYIVKVTVSDVNGTLIAKADFPSGGIVFENTYTATNAEISLNGTKILTGRDIVDGEFTFVLTGDGIETKEVTNVGATFDFGTIKYEQAGVYTYTVSEKVGTEKGITFDNSIYTVTVNVVDNGIGSLVASVTYKKDGLDATAISFRNGYVAEPNEFVIEGRKELTGRNLNEDEFEFTLIGGHTNAVYETVKNDANGNFRFTALPVYEAGTYRVRVVEENTALGGISYDNSIFTAVITVSDDLKGNLVIDDITYYRDAEESDEGIVFNNTYKAAQTTVTLGGAKELSGRDLNEGEFTFELYDKATGKLIESVTNDSKGVFTFTAITYTEAGVHNYKIVEKKGESFGVTYDEAIYNVTVNVTDDLDGKLEATTAMTVEGKQTDGDTVLFNNTFDPGTAKVIITVNKTVNNKTVQKIGLDGFEFVLTDKDSNTLKAVSNEQGVATFELTFDKESVGKELTYKLSETKGSMEGMTYSDKVYEYVIKVDYDKDYKLVTTVTKDGKTENALTAEFVNVYEGVPPTGDPTTGPDTGDDFSVNTWLAVLFVGGGVIPFALKKKKKEE